MIQRIALATVASVGFRFARRTPLKEHRAPPPPALLCLRLFRLGDRRQENPGECFDIKAVSAYRAASRLTDARLDRTQDFVNKPGVIR